MKLDYSTLKKINDAEYSDKMSSADKSCKKCDCDGICCVTNMWCRKHICDYDFTADYPHLYKGVTYHDRRDSKCYEVLSVDNAHNLCKCQEIKVDWKTGRATDYVGSPVKRTFRWIAQYCIIYHNKLKGALI